MAQLRRPRPIGHWSVNCFPTLSERRRISLAPVRKVVPSAVGTMFGFRQLRTECVESEMVSDSGEAPLLKAIHVTASGRHCHIPTRYFSRRVSFAKSSL